MNRQLHLSAFVVLSAWAAASMAIAAAADKPAVRYCSNCATVDSVRKVDGKAPDAVPSAVDQAVPGRLAKPAQHFEVILHDSAGARRTLTFDNDPGVKAGEAIKVNNGVLERDTGPREVAPAK